MIAVRSSLTIPILAVAVFAATLGWFGYRHLRRDPAAAGPAVATTAPASPTPARAELAAETPVRTAALPAPAEIPSARALPGAPAASPAHSAAAPDPATPAFDVVRVEPSGEAVIAGRAPAGTAVELLVDGRPHAETVADPSGHFALVPRPLPVGSHELALRATAPGSSGTVSTQSVAIVIAGNRRDAPLVTVMAPGQPALVLSRPDAPTRVASADPASPVPAGPPVAARTPREARTDPAVSSTVPADRSSPRRPEPAGPSSSAGTRPLTAGPVPATRPGAKPSLEIVSVEAEGTGRLYVSGTATPSATVRLYLNDTFIAPGSAGPDGRIAFSIERGIRPGSYRVRLDEVDPGSGAVRSRAEVPFAMPVEIAAAVTGPVAAPRGPAPEVSTGTGEADSGRTVARAPAGPGSGAPPDRTAAAGPVPSARATPVGPAMVVVSEVNTATVSPGESLWEISRRTYGEGLRYTVIYGANSGQIRDPNLIYPGQIFVLPSSSRQGALR